MQAIGYVRVSTDKQAETGGSLEAQAEKIRAMSVVHSAELLDVIVDGGESAKSMNRPGLRQLLALVAVAESLDTGSAAGRLVIKIMASVSEWEREAIGERTRDVLQHKRSCGERVGNIHYGFRLAPDQKHVEPDPDEQAVLATVRALRARHRSLRE